MFISSPEASKKAPADLIQQDEPGQYVYYQDTRQGRNRLTGLLKADANRLLIRTIDLHGNTSTSVAAQLTTQSGKTLIKILEVFNGSLKRDRVFIKDEIQDMFNARQEWVKKGMGKSPFITKAGKCTFDKWVPLIGLNQIQAEKGSLQLSIVGRDEPPILTFVDLTSMPKEKANDAVRIKVQSKKKVTIFNRNFTFDKNWKLETAGQGGAKLSAYLLQVQGDRDAMLAFEEYPVTPEDTKPDNLFEQARNAVLAVPASWILPDTFQWTNHSDGSLEFKFTSLHVVSLRKTDHRLLFLPLPKQKRLRIINFSSFREFMQKNPSYFKRLLQPAGFKL